MEAVGSWETLLFKCLICLRKKGICGEDVVGWREKLCPLQ